MKSLFLVAVHQAATQAVDRPAMRPQSEENLLRARAAEMRRQRPWGLVAVIKGLIPATLTARIAARRAERDLQAHIQRLEELSGHLLQDIGVEKVGPSDYVAATIDMALVRAGRLAEAQAQAQARPQARAQRPAVRPLTGWTAVAQPA